jgi:hypothetical protein
MKSIEIPRDIVFGLCPELRDSLSYVYGTVVIGIPDWEPFSKTGFHRSYSCMFKRNGFCYLEEGKTYSSWKITPECNKRFGQIAKNLYLLREL